MSVWWLDAERRRSQSTMGDEAFEELYKQWMAAETHAERLRFEYSVRQEERRLMNGKAIEGRLEQTEEGHAGQQGGAAEAKQGGEVVPWPTKQGGAALGQAGEGGD